MDLKPYNEQEFNRLCVEFIGYVNRTPTDPDFNIYENKNGFVIDGKQYTILETMSMKFHSDWNWINEIKEKIRSLGWRFDVSHSGSVSKSNNIVVFIWEKYCGGGDWTVVELEEMNEKEAVVRAIWQFLQWYNEQK
jgi:hypothetical protein